MRETKLIALLFMIVVTNALLVGTIGRKWTIELHLKKDFMNALKSPVLAVTQPLRL